MAVALSPPAGLIQGNRHFYALRVYYEDTDLTGIVYHANYLRWFERARSDLLRLLGIDQRAAVEAGEGNYAVAGIDLRYLAPARLDDAVQIETGVIDLRAASVALHQQARRGETVLADARVRVGFVGPAGRARRQPAAWRESFARYLSAESPT
jgi:acyl-CoA thioester hydrolase